MRPLTRLFVLCGCVLVAALEARPCARLACEDWLGPYASADPGLLAATTDAADAEDLHDGDEDAGGAALARLGDVDAR